MKSLNDALLERKVDAQYATLTVLLWEPRERKLTFCNAGGEPPLVFRNGEVMTLKATGVPIGLLDDREYEEVEFQAENGDLMLLYSDGVEDQLNASEKDFSRGRVRDVIKKHGNEIPKRVVDAIFADLDLFRGGIAITDDQTVVAMRVT